MPKKRTKKTVRRRDRDGHIDPKYAAELRAKGNSKPPEDGRAFVKGSHSRDDLAEALAEEVIESATKAEYEAEDAFNQNVPEETGGPFVTTTGTKEFAHGTDESNPKGALREPFPRT